jgi:PleD family two-component response regulator
LSPKRKQEYQKVTISAGIIELDLKAIKKVQEALNLAEKPLQYAKNNCRNQAVRFSKLTTK